MHKMVKIKLGLVLFCFIFGLFTAEAKPEEKPPNVILILADDMGIGDVGFVNEGKTHTPAIDQLIKDGVWFEQAFTAAPVCAPARASLLTGQYPQRTGCVTLNMRTYPQLSRMKKELNTLADAFNANGYVTGLVGKWHCGTGYDYHPLRRGFQEFEGFHGFNVPSYFDYELVIQDSVIEVRDKYLTEDLSERAIRFVRRHAAEPFFLHLAHYAPHRPLGAPQEVVNKYLEEGFPQKTAVIYAMIEIMDEGIGELVEELGRLQIRENTVILFASDNGPDPLPGERFNANLKGTKYMVNEGGIRVPFVVNWPAQYQSRKEKAVVHFTDVFPTLVDICELNVPFRQKADGKSFAGLLRGENSELPETRMWQWNRGVPVYSYNAAIRDRKSVV